MTVLTDMNEYSFISLYSSEALCDDLMKKCRGIDDSRIEDDHGGLPKTVSVENSFRRNTVRTSDAMWRALQDLFQRLPRLLDDRRANSECPDQSYPTTIRLTAGIVDKQLLHTKKRPFVTRSKQCTFSAGKALMAETGNVTKRIELIRKAVTPLVESLVLNDGNINVVRINIAVTGFQDLQESPSASLSPWAAFTTTGPEDQWSKRQRTQTKNGRERGQDSGQKVKRRPSVGKLFASAKSHSTPMESIMPSTLKVDPAVLAELPPDIRAEVCRTYDTKVTSKRTIDQFFGKKR
jgi:hypothetical protein